MALLKSLYKAGNTLLHSNEPINAFKGMGGIKGALTADYAEWGAGKIKALGIAGKTGKDIENMTWKQVAKSAFMNEEGAADFASIGAAYVGANMAINGNMGIPFISSR